MKKILAVMLAAATTMSVGMTVLADDIDTLEPVVDSGSSEPSEPDVEVAMSELSGIRFANDADGASLFNDILEPGTEYKFPVSLAFTKEGKEVVKPVSSKLMDGYKFSYSRISSKGVKRFEIEESKGVYYLYVETSDTTSTKLNDVKYNVKVVNKSNNLSTFAQEVKFQYGHDEANSDYIDGLDKGDSVEIDNSNPVITGAQFNKIAKINDYKNVTLSGNGWEMNVNVTDETTKNFVFTNAGIKAVMSKFPDQDFKFFSFSGKPTFSATGRVSLDVSDVIDDFANLYTYRYADGKLYRISTTLDNDENTLNFRTNRLDNFIVTDKQIKDGTVVSTDDVNNGTDSDDNETDIGGGNGSTDKENPETGAGNMIDIAVMSAIAALSAGTLIAKKRSK